MYDQYLTFEFVIYLQIVTFNCVLSSFSQYKDRVIHGDIATYGEFPFLIAIVFEDKETLKCSGALITVEHVLTAAHCYGLETAYPKTYCLAGDIHRGRLEGPIRQVREVIDVTLHPGSVQELEQHGEVSVQFDLAVLTVQEKFLKNEYVNTIPLSTYDLENEAPCISIGFGTTSKATNTTPTIYALNYAKMTMDRSMCARVVRFPTTYCTYNPEQMIYYGDSGSPLINARPPFKCFGVLAHFDTKCPICAIYSNVRTCKNWIIHQMVFRRLPKHSGKEKLGFIIYYFIIEASIVLKMG